MNFVAVTQRVDLIPQPDGAVERRDGLDQAWPAFLAAAGCLAIPLPNNLPLARRMLQELPIDGLVLSGGGDLGLYGGETPERDEVERSLLAMARGFPTPMPVLGVCRGMQLIQGEFGVVLGPVEGHVTHIQEIEIDGEAACVNAYHHWGTRRSLPQLEVWAQAPDGVVKAIRHRNEPIVGLMWHPERVNPFAQRDLELFRTLFGDAGEVVT
jgi:putative glutamine amidotransferase